MKYVKHSAQYPLHRKYLIKDRYFYYCSNFMVNHVVQYRKQITFVIHGLKQFKVEHLFTCILLSYKAKTKYINTLFCKKSFQRQAFKILPQITSLHFSFWHLLSSRFSQQQVAILFKYLVNSCYKICMSQNKEKVQHKIKTLLRIQALVRYRTNSP